jgi:nicotinamidase-related amidase
MRYQRKEQQTMSVPFVPGKTVEVPDIAYRDEVRLPAKNTAVIVVDMQNDFVKEGGSLVVEAAMETVPKIQQLLEAARAGGARVAYTQDTHYEGDLEWEIWPEHCRSGSWGWEIIDELKPRSEDPICQTVSYDGFYGTSLEHFVSRVWQVQHLVVVGTVSNICVAHTVASAGMRWFRVIIPANGSSALTEFDQAMLLRQASWLYGGDVVRDVAHVKFE